MNSKRICDLRELKDIPERFKDRFGFWRDSSFVWKRWDRPNENWTHDHCSSCFACICDHRERFPEWKQAQEERGCYRHAYYTVREGSGSLWICRNCFKRLKSEFNWVGSP
jgi:hypothetical protein